ncbi:hypothetical protein LSPH24S_01781 [Lysinibacillus sphaericus]
MAEQNGEIIAGKNPVLEALRSGRDTKKMDCRRCKKIRGSMDCLI